MFDFLKKKIAGWLGKDKKKSGKESVKTARTPKKKAPKSAKERPGKALTKKEKKIEAEVKQIIKESETRLEVPKPAEEKTGGVEEEKEGNFFTKLIRKISKSKLSKPDFDELFMELELILLENNVALEAVDKIKENLSHSLVGQQMKKTEAEARILQSLKDSILDLLIESPDLIKQIKDKEGTFTIILFGINGTGKTTTIAKVAYLLKKDGISRVLAAADTFRAASIEQLKLHGERLGIPVISQHYGADPAAVAFDAKKYAAAHNIKVVLVDTAGRMYTKENLLKEMEKIIRIAKPDLKLFIGESITGNDVISQARTFNESISIDGIILTKSDIDDRGGAILSVSHVVKKPIYFLGTGQSYKDLQKFKKKDILKHLGLE